MILPSSTKNSDDIYPNNTVSAFHIRRSKTMYLTNKYEVALAEIMYPHTWPTFNVKQDVKHDLKHANRIVQIFTVSISPGYYTEMDELIKELNGADEIKPLIVPPVKAEEINCEELRNNRRVTNHLGKLWKHAEEKCVFAGKNQRTYQYTMRKEILYRIYSRRHAGTMTETRQIVVPATLRKQVMKLTKKSIVGGHLGCKKTVDRITPDLYWPVNQR